MASDENFYGGGNYGLDYGSSESSESSEFVGYRVKPGDVGLALDVRTAAQLQEVSTKLNTGAKVVEVQGVSPQVWEAIPEQHLQEINRLRKLIGAEVTLHGPIVEPSGLTREGWDDTQREQAERQMWSAVERGHQLSPDGNLVVTFHTSGLPELKTKVKTIEEGKPVEKVTSMLVIDERTGRVAPLRMEESYFLGQRPEPEKELDKLNRENWFRTLSHVNFQAHQGAQQIEGVGELMEKTWGPEAKKHASEVYSLSLKDPRQVQRAINDLKEAGKVKEAQSTEKIIDIMNHGDIYLRDAYNELKNLYDQAYDAAKREGREEDIKKLNTFREDIKPRLKDIEDPSKIDEFGREIIKGVNVLRTIAHPRTFKPMEEFAIEKSSETFANVAFNAYKKFKDTAPIISVENPPANMALSRAGDMRKLIDEARAKFVEKAKKEMHMSESEAKKQAEKLIGATWDVGHINMIRKYGYGEKEILEETKKIAPYVKHVHLSDNFGLEHTELPMGMGNVPIKGHMELIEKYNKQVKKIIEAGDWYQHFKTSPFPETLAAFGSPVYGMKMAPYWSQAAGIAGVPGYFSGYGLNPDIHHSIYGSGLTNLPVELGGQQPGGRARMGGAPIE